MNVKHAERRKTTYLLAGPVGVVAVDVVVDVGVVADGEPEIGANVFFLYFIQ